MARKRQPPAVKAGRADDIRPNVCSNVGVRVWGWTWRVDITYDHAMPHPVYRRHRQETVTSVTDLRAVVLAARADPSVVAYRYVRLPCLLGDPPAACPRGHPWDVWVRRPTERPGWHGCECGGHEVFRCSPCGLWLLDPPLSSGCVPFDPRAPWRRRRR